MLDYDAMSDEELIREERRLRSEAARLTRLADRARDVVNRRSIDQFNRDAAQAKRRAEAGLPDPLDAILGRDPAMYREDHTQ